MNYLLCRLFLYIWYSSFKLSDILQTRLCNSLIFGSSSLILNKEAPSRVKWVQNLSTSLSLFRHNIIPKISLSRLNIQNELPDSICRSELIDIIPISSRISRVRPKLSLKARRDFPILATDIWERRYRNDCIMVCIEIIICKKLCKANNLKRLIIRV